MPETIRATAARLATEVAQLLEELEAGDMSAALERGRQVAKRAGQVLQRLNAVQDVLNEGFSAAEVDRMLRRQE
jgi:hypothetical protein